jgi:hypothetical protein
MALTEVTMSQFVLPAVIAVVLLIVLSEIAAAIVPLIIVLACVPVADRPALAHLIATCDSSRKLRAWPALRVAVTHRREQRAAADRLLNPPDEALFPINPPCPACGQAAVRMGSWSTPHSATSSAHAPAPATTPTRFKA